jgi:hypothetical protein
MATRIIGNGPSTAPHPPLYISPRFLQYLRGLPTKPWHALSQSLVTVWNSAFTHSLPRALPGNTVCSTPDGILRWGGAVFWRYDVGQ